MYVCVCVFHNFYSICYITLKPLTSEVNNTDYLVTLASVKRWDVCAVCASGQSVLKVDLSEAGKMGKCEDLSDSDKGQTVMTRRLDQSVSKKCRSCSMYAVVCTYQWSRRRTTSNPVTSKQGSLMYNGRLVRSHRRATVAQAGQKIMLAMQIAAYGAAEQSKCPC